MDVTYNFTAGTRAVAQQVNQNFADVKSAVDTIESNISTIQDDITDLQEQCKQLNLEMVAKIKEIQ